MKKNFMAPILKNKTANKVVGSIGKFYVAHESAILTGGTIGFSLATTVVTYRNASRIKDILAAARSDLDSLQGMTEEDIKEEKKHIYASTLKSLTPLILPIVMFQAATIGTALYSKKQSDKKLAAAAGALSIAEQAIAQYQTWQKETEEALGEKKYEKLQNDIYKKQDVDGNRFPSTPMKGSGNEVLVISKYCGRPFWCQSYKIEYAVAEMSRRLDSDGGYDVQTIDDLYELIGNPDLTPTALTGKFGYLAGGQSEIRAGFADTHYVFPNGERVPAFELYLWPEPEDIELMDARYSSY